MIYILINDENYVSPVQQALNCGKDIASDFLDDGIQMAKDYLDDPDNRKKLREGGIKIQRWQ